MGGGRKYQTAPSTKNFGPLQKSFGSVEFWMSVQEEQSNDT